MNNKPADEKDTLDPDRNPDIKNPDGTATLPPESAPAASPIERFYGNMHQSAPIVSLRNRAAAEIHSNPVIMLDRLVGQSLGGESGTNFRWNCCDGGVVKPSKLIATLKTLLNDIKRASTHQNFAAFLTPDGITNLLCEYRDLLKGLAADYELEEEFMEHSRKLRLPETRPHVFIAPLPPPSRPDLQEPVTESGQKPGADAPAERKPRRTYIGMPERSPGAVVPAVTMTSPVQGVKEVRHKTLMMGSTLDDKPLEESSGRGSAPKKRVTVQMASATGRKPPLISGLGEEIDYETVPGDEGAVSIRISPIEYTPGAYLRRKQVLIDFSALHSELFAKLDAEAKQKLYSISTSVEALGPDFNYESDLSESAEGDDAPAQQIRQSEYPAAREKSNSLPPGLSPELFAQKQLADKEYQNVFMDKYRDLCVRKGTEDHGCVDSGMVFAAMNKALAEMEKHPDAYGDFNNFYRKFMDAGRFEALIKELTAELADKVPAIKEKANTDFRQVFIPAYLGRFDRKNTGADSAAAPVSKKKEAKSRKKPSAGDHFSRHFDAALQKAVGILRKKGGNKSREFQLYYPKGKLMYGFLSNKVAMDMARDEARKLVQRLNFIIDRILQTMGNRNLITSLSDRDLEAYCERTKNGLLEWLYSVLPNEKGDMPWLLYFFNQKEKTEILAELGDEIFDIIRANCLEYRDLHGTGQTAAAPAAAKNEHAAVIPGAVLAPGATLGPGAAKIPEIPVTGAAPDDLEAGETTLVMDAADLSVPAGDDSPTTLRTPEITDAQAEAIPDAAADAPPATGEPRPAQKEDLENTLVQPDEVSTAVPAAVSEKVRAESEKFGQVASLFAASAGYALRDPVHGSMRPPEPGDAESAPVDAGAVSQAAYASQIIPFGRPAAQAADRKVTPTGESQALSFIKPRETFTKPAETLLTGTVVIDPAIRTETEQTQYVKPVLDAYAEQLLYEEGWVKTGEWRVVKTPGGIEYTHNDGHKIFENRPLAQRPSQPAMPASRPPTPQAALIAPAALKAVEDGRIPERERPTAKSLKRPAEPMLKSYLVDEPSTNVPVQQEIPVPEKKGWFRRNWGKVVAAVGAAAAITGGALLYNYGNGSDDSRKENAVEVAKKFGRKESEVKVAQADPKPSASPQTNAEPKVPDATPEPAPDASFVYSAPQELIYAVTDPSLKKMLSDGLMKAEFGRGGVGAHIIRLDNRLINDLAAHGKISPQKAAEVRQMMSKMASDINVGQAAHEYDYYTGKTPAELNEIRSDGNHPDHEEFVYLEHAWGPIGTWAAQLGGMEARVPDIKSKKTTYLTYESGIKNQNGGRDINRLMAGDEINLGLINLFSETVKALSSELEAGAKSGTPARPIDLDNQWTDEPQKNQPQAPQPGPTIKLHDHPGAAPTGAPQSPGIVPPFEKPEPFTPQDAKQDGGRTGMFEPENSPEIKVTGYEEIENTWEDDDSPEITVTEIAPAKTASADAAREKAKADAAAVRARIDAEIADIDWEPPQRSANDSVRAKAIADAAKVRAKIDAEIADIDWELPGSKPAAEKSKAPSLEEKIAKITSGGFEGRRQALLERGQVFVPPLNKDMDGSAMHAIRNGLMMACGTEGQEREMALLLNTLRFSHMTEYHATEKGTYAELDPDFHRAAVKIIKGGNAGGVREIVRGEIAAAASGILKQAA